MPSSITIIRHAESLYNNGTATESQLKNCKLSEQGKVQASSELNGLEFDLLILSPLKRAVETYAYSNIKTADIVISHLFREWKTSKLNMMDGEEEDPIGSSFETQEQFENRTHLALEFLKSLSEKYKKIGIISHHDFIHCFFKIHSGRQDISLANCAYIPFHFLD